MSACKKQTIIRSDNTTNNNLPSNDATYTEPPYVPLTAQAAFAAEQNPAANANILVGKWVLPCTAYSSQFYTDILVIDGTTLTKTVSFFSDQDCKTPLQVNKSVETYQVGRNLVNPAGFIELTLTAQKFTRTLLDAAAVKAANEGKLLDITSWAVGTEQDITGKTDDLGQEYKVNAEFKTIFKIDASKLSMGDRVTVTDDWNTLVYTSVTDGYTKAN